MALTDLGTKVIFPEDGWVGFTPIVLPKSERYQIEVSFVSANVPAIYSSFIFRYKYSSTGSPNLYSSTLAKLFFDSEIQTFNFLKPSFVILNQPIVLQARRIAYWANPNQLATVSLNLKVDPLLSSKV